MEDISFFFKPSDILIDTIEEKLSGKIQYHTEGNFPELQKNAIAIIYCPEFRRGIKKYHSLKDDNFRKAFAELYLGENWNFPIYDLGTILPGENYEDTCFALKKSVAELVKQNILPIVVGGSQDLTFTLYKAYELLEQTINITSVDAQFDLGSPEEDVQHDGFVSQILMQRPCYLFNYSVIGIQAPLSKPSEFTLFDKLHFDTCRLGEFNSDFKIAEPFLRNADLLSLDLQALKYSEIIGDEFVAPNGFSSEQICQIAKYAGISDKLTSFGIFNLFPSNLNQITHQLLAQIIWYFIDGFAHRKKDFPMGSKNKYKKFIVSIDKNDSELIFYKSDKSERWWMEVPYPPKQGLKYERHHLVPCNYEDYLLAMQNEMPDLWWRTYQKLN